MNKPLSRINEHNEELMRLIDDYGWACHDARRVLGWSRRKADSHEKAVAIYHEIADRITALAMAAIEADIAENADYLADGEAA